MLILRKDILEKIKTAELFIFNVEVLSGSSDELNKLSTTCKTSGKSLISSLNKIGVRVIGFRPSEKPVEKENALGIEIIQLNGNRKIDLLSYFEGSYSFRDMVVMGSDIEDIDIIRHCRFSTTTINAPLELKMESQYVSNFSGIKAFEEVGNLIIHAKRDNGQH